MLITAPAAGDIVNEHQKLTLRADATDDIAVAAVRFFVNGVIVGTDTARPFETVFTVPVGVASLSIRAEASDFGDNVGVSQDVIVPVTSGDSAGIPPTVHLTAPVVGESLIGGQSFTLRADATDDIAVLSVSFFINGELVFTDFDEPFEFPFDVPAAVVRIFTVYTEASDLGDNVNISQVIIVPVIDTRGTVVGRTVDTTGNAIAGATVNCLGGTSITTGADGSFSITGLSLLRVRIWCIGTFTTASGAIITGTSAQQNQDMAVIDVGDIILGGDQDGDGLPDDFEAAHSCLNPTVPDGNADPDGDRLTNLDEINHGTLPGN